MDIPGAPGGVAALFRPPQPPRDRDKHYSLVDFLRFVAALSVLLWHYQHFYFVGDSKGPLFAGRWVQPGYSVLGFFYENGALAVWFFWAISGFVFAHSYAGKRTGAGEYAVNRFSRLYPLHLLTLLVVAVLQAVSLHGLGVFQIYQVNDAYHFLLNLAFASHWGLQEGFSFNAPIWSVSVEVILYVIFFLFLGPAFRFGLAGPLAFCAGFAALLAAEVGGGDVWRCGLLFYVGAGVYVLLAQSRRRPVVPLLAGVLLALVPAVLAEGNGPFRLAPLFGGIILAAAALESLVRLPFRRAMRWLGDCTYGVYLWHVPVQIAVMIGFDALRSDRAAVGSGWFLALFLVSVVMIARVSFVRFEDPARRLLRRGGAVRRVAAAG